MIFVNFKTYEQGTGGAAVKLAEICTQVAKGASVKIIPVVQTADIFQVVRLIKIPVWVQHVDDIEFGANTGQTLPEAAKAAGAVGTLLNHSENKLPMEIIGETIKRCYQVGLKTLVCSESVEEGKQIVQARPDFLAYEPPELIGRDVSVSSVRVEVVRDFVEAKLGIPVVIGAGIHSQADVRKGLKLGAKGFLVSSGVVLSKNPRKKLLDLTGGFK
jgi:triosephosphate isomerase